MRRSERAVAVLGAWLLGWTLGFGDAQAQNRPACDFAAAKGAIDAVLDKDAAKGAQFRKEFKEGTDPFTIIEGMVEAQARAMIDVCRFQAAEYFTKRGFPPAH